MRAFSAKGNSSAPGPVTVDLTGPSASGVSDAAIEVIEISGDNSATIGVSGANSGSGTSPAVALSGLTAGSGEIFFGDAQNSPTWNSIANYSSVGTTQSVPTTSTIYDSAIYVGASASSVAGAAALGSSQQWGTIGIEIKP